MPPAPFLRQLYINFDSEVFPTNNGFPESIHDIGKYGLGLLGHNFYASQLKFPQGFLLKKYLFFMFSARLYPKMTKNR